MTPPAPDSSSPTNAAVPRRELLLGAAASAAALGSAHVARAVPALGFGRAHAAPSPNDTLRIGVIGTGARGQDHLWALGYAVDDPVYAHRKGTVVEPIAGTAVVAVCDAYEDKLDQAHAAVRARGGQPGRYTSWRKMLDEAHLDAVVIATPDHLHGPLALAAVEAGCDVYVEKCMTNRAEELAPLGAALEKHGRILQVGYQMHQDRLHQLAREMIAHGELGEVHSVQTFLHRNTESGAWKHPDAARGAALRERIHWDEFLGGAPAREFDASRFFEWRQYWDYSTGLSGDVFSHTLSAAQYLLDLPLPETASASGGVYHWRDQRETPDHFSATVEFPSKRVQVNFLSTLSNSFFRRSALAVCGSKATLELSWRLSVYAEQGSELFERLDKEKRRPYERPYVDIQDNAARLVVQGAPSSRWLEGRGATATTAADGSVHDTTRLHHEEWVRCIRARTQPSASYASSLCSTIGAHLATQSYRQGRRMRWDAEKRQIV